MRLPVLSCEFIVSPAVCSPEAMETHIESLMEARATFDQPAVTVALEDDALQKLIDDGCYPAEGIFKKNLAACNLESYSSRDLAKLVNSIIERGASLSEVLPERLVEWIEKVVDPELKSRSATRSLAIGEIVENLSIDKHVRQTHVSLLHYLEQPHTSEVKLSGIASCIYPESASAEPVAVSESVPVFSVFKCYLASLDSGELFDSFQTVEQLKLAFYVAALERLKKTGRSINDLGYDGFGIGERFVESIRLNQCMPHQSFGRTMLSVVAKILTCVAENELTAFTTEAGNDEQRTSGRYRAYREHITKSGLALRLMFWRDNDGHIILANVGPKQELFIENP